MPEHCVECDHELRFNETVSGLVCVNEACDRYIPTGGTIDPTLGNYQTGADSTATSDVFAHLCALWEAGRSSFFPSPLLREMEDELVYFAGRYFGVSSELKSWIVTKREQGKGNGNG